MVALVDQLSPGAGLVVPHHLTIALLMRTLILTLGRTRKSVIPPPWYKGGGGGGGGVGGGGGGGGVGVDGTRVFDMLEYSETILPSVEGL